MVLTHHPISTAVAAAAASQTILKRPSGGNVRLKAISVYTEQILSFGKWDGYFVRVGAAYPAKDYRTVFEPRIIDETKDTPVVLFQGDIEWPKDWQLVLDCRTQTASEVIHFSIAYEILPEKEITPTWWPF